MATKQMSVRIGLPLEDYNRIPDAVRARFEGVPLNRSAFVRWAVKMKLDEILGPVKTRKPGASNA